MNTCPYCKQLKGVELSKDLFRTMFAEDAANACPECRAKFEEYFIDETMKPIEEAIKKSTERLLRRFLVNPKHSK